jgi:hypothetical protein
LTSFRQVLSSAITRLALHRAQKISLPVQIQNPGSETWVGTARFPVTVSYKWFESGNMLPIEGERTVFPGSIQPGAATTVNIRVVAPERPGHYALRITLVQEGVAWFMVRQYVPGTIGERELTAQSRFGAGSGRSGDNKKSRRPIGRRLVRTCRRLLSGIGSSFLFRPDRSP